MLMVTPTSFSTRKSMISSVSRVALVVRLKPIPRPWPLSLVASVLHHLAQQPEVHQRLAAEEGDVHRLAALGLLEQEVH